MYDLLSEYVDRCNKGEHFGMEIRELPEEPRQPAKVSLFEIIEYWSGVSFDIIIYGP